MRKTIQTPKRSHKKLPTPFFRLPSECAIEKLPVDQRIRQTRAHLDTLLKERAATVAEIELRLGLSRTCKSRTCGQPLPFRARINQEYCGNLCRVRECLARKAEKDTQLSANRVKTS
jgi:hypothetical protein